jgi:hypothetical protein
MKLPLPAQIDKGKTYLLGGESLIELMKRPRIIGTHNEILVREDEDGTRTLSLAHNDPLIPPYLPPWNLYITARGNLTVSFTYDSGTGLWTSTNTNHGLTADAPVVMAMSVAGTMADAFVAGTTYYARDIGSTTLKLAASAGGAAITGGTTGSGLALRYNGIAMKINPISTLMKTWSYRTYWKDSTWKDKADVTNSNYTFILTDADHVVWLEVVFVSGSMSTFTIKSGARWNSDLRYVSADNHTLGSGSFTWYQLLAYFKLSSDPGGSEKDFKFTSSWHKLMCPTTTHLMQGYVTGSTISPSGGFIPDELFAIIPWHGCVWFGS